MLHYGGPLHMQDLPKGQEGYVRAAVGYIPRKGKSLLGSEVLWLQIYKSWSYVQKEHPDYEAELKPFVPPRK